ncbi:LysR family transcriptional regulator [Streptomyces sp. NPDC050738]|uniref:LysR family transcriptional regulator n=1 Tax=Streptomyces sp. NPDC050738 TaxID=3154744 RepID=UPI003443C5C4
MELRDIEIFLVLAEELHFGRTADRLHVSPARVSQAIKKQERRLGVALFERTSRSVILTPVGRRLREDLKQAHDLIQMGLARASVAGQGIRGTLTLGSMGVAANLIRPVIERFQAEFPGCDVEIVETHFSSPFSPSRSGKVDLQLLWLPVCEPDLSVGPVVFTEGRVLAVATDSDLAGRESVTLEDLGGRLVPDMGAEAAGYWGDAMIPTHTPSGRLIPRGKAPETFHEVLSMVVAGDVVSPVNEHVTRYYTHPDITFLPFTGVPATDWALVWSATADSALLRAFLESARDGSPRRTPVPQPASEISPTV